MRVTTNARPWSNPIRIPLTGATKKANPSLAPAVSTRDKTDLKASTKASNACKGGPSSTNDFATILSKQFGQAPMVAVFGRQAQRYGTEANGVVIFSPTSAMITSNTGTLSVDFRPTNYRSTSIEITANGGTPVHVDSCMVDVKFEQIPGGGVHVRFMGKDGKDYTSAIRSASLKDDASLLPESISGTNPNYENGGG
jgi:hypothetical protein